MRRFAVFTAALTYCLVLLGGIVHNTRSSLACPDWPLCFGRVFPKMEGGVLVEHSHRLLASTVGLCTLALMVMLIRHARRHRLPHMGWFGIIIFACVVFQGVLGGLTVIYRLPTLVSTTHLAVSMLFFSLLLYVIWRTGPRARPLSSETRSWTLAAAIAVYAQMILGAFMRHLGAGLACLDIPLCGDRLWPAGAHGSVQLHALHRWTAVIVLGVVVAASVVTFRHARGRRGVQAMALLAPFLVVVQIALGLLSVSSFLAVVPVTAHLGVAALLLGDLVYLHLLARLVEETAQKEVEMIAAGVGA